MPERLIRFLVGLYPRAWRARYGPELAETATEAYDSGYASLIEIASDLLVGACIRRLRSRPSRRMTAIGTAVSILAMSTTVCLAIVQTDRHRNINLLAHRTAGALKITFDPNNGHVVAVSGPAFVTMDPRTGRVVEVSRAGS